MCTISISQLRTRAYSSSNIVANRVLCFFFFSRLHSGFFSLKKKKKKKLVFTYCECVFCEFIIVRSFVVHELMMRAFSVKGVAVYTIHEFTLNRTSHTRLLAHSRAFAHIRHNIIIFRGWLSNSRSHTTTHSREQRLYGKQTNVCFFFFF